MANVLPRPPRGPAEGAVCGRILLATALRCQLVWPNLSPPITVVMDWQGALKK